MSKLNMEISNIWIMELSKDQKQVIRSVSYLGVYIGTLTVIDWNSVDQKADLRE